jgi:hypothetical protein
LGVETEIEGFTDLDELAVSLSNPASAAALPIPLALAPVPAPSLMASAGPSARYWLPRSAPPCRRSHPRR